MNIDKNADDAVIRIQYNYKLLFLPIGMAILLFTDISILMTLLVLSIVGYIIFFVVRGHLNKVAMLQKAAHTRVPIIVRAEYDQDPNVFYKEAIWIDLLKKSGNKLPIAVHAFEHKHWMEDFDQYNKRVDEEERKIMDQWMDKMSKEYPDVYKYECLNMVRPPASN